MLSLLSEHPLFCALILILLDLGLWRLISSRGSEWKLLVRVLIFSLFSAVLFNEGLNPMEPAPWADNVPLHLAATGLQIGWWLFGARTLTVLIGAVMMQRVGHTGRLLQDLLGAVIFLIAIIAALAYVLDLPVKGVLATSGALAIIVGLALQSTLSDVFSGIVLNTTKPYQLDDWISIDGTEGRVTDIDWRATRLQTSQGSMAVIPNSLAAKAKIINFSRPSNMFGVAVSVQVSPHARPNSVIDALERAMQGCRQLLDTPAPSVALKSSGSSGAEYEISGFVASMGEKRVVRNQLFDLAYRHLQASGVNLLSSDESNAPTQPFAATGVARQLADFLDLASGRERHLQPEHDPANLPRRRADSGGRGGQRSPVHHRVRCGHGDLDPSWHTVRIRTHGAGRSDRRGRYSFRFIGAGHFRRENLLRPVPHRKVLPETVPGRSSRHQRSDENLARLSPAQSADR